MKYGALFCLLKTFECWVFFHALLSSANFFQNQFFQKNSFTMSNSLDPDEALHFVGPDQGPNCLQRISTCNLEAIFRVNSLPTSVACWVETVCENISADDTGRSNNP